MFVLHFTASTPQNYGKSWRFGLLFEVWAILFHTFGVQVSPRFSKPNFIGSWSKGEGDDPLPSEHFILDPSEPRMAYIGSLDQSLGFEVGAVETSGLLLRNLV